MKRRLAGFALVLAVLCEPQAAFAYLDPGTGSMLLSVVVGLVSGAYFFIRRLPGLTRAFLFRLAGKKDDLKGNAIVFYSEGKSYWSTFEPVLKSLEALGVKSVFLTSDDKDPIFTSDLKLVRPKFIGKGNTAYTALGFLEADVFVLTTPGIDVLQIRRSPGVKKYIHIVHAIGDIHTYKFYSFDYYDAVFCSGPGQVKSLRALEKLRGTPKKDLPVLGCAYLDRLVARYAKEGDRHEENTVLVAPTWGKNGLLTRTGAAIPLLLAKAGYRVILRPHPQSFVSDVKIMDGVIKAVENIPEIELDRNPDGFASLSRAAIMVSDVSSVMFDFSFVFLRPVISVGDGPLKDGFEAWEIPHGAWESGILNDIGVNLPEGSENEIVSEVRRLLDGRATLGEKILAIRDENVANFGKAGPVIARALAKYEEKAVGEKHA